MTAGKGATSGLVLRGSRYARRRLRRWCWRPWVASEESAKRRGSSLTDALLDQISEALAPSASAILVAVERPYPRQ